MKGCRAFSRRRYSRDGVYRKARRRTTSPDPQRQENADTLNNLRCALRPYINYVLISLVVLTVARLGLMAWQQERLDGHLILQTLTNGFRVDIMMLSMTLILPALLLAGLPGFMVKSLFFQQMTTVWLATWLIALVFMEVVTPAYMDFFSVRPGRIFFEYLNRPMEVAGLVSVGYPVVAILGFVVPILLVIVALPRLSTMPPFEWRWQHRLILLPVILALLLGARASLGHRPANPSTFAISGDQLVNELGLNSLYRLLYSVYSLRHEEDPGRVYPKMAPDAVIAAVRLDSGIPATAFTDQNTTLHRFGHGETVRPLKNILIIVEESLGARFVGALGGMPLTPYLDGMAETGIWLERLYATGIRSARGLEAIVAGFPPSSARSVLKLSGSQGDFYTMAESLRPLGYRNYFIYGGEANFDNMQGFFLNNGFDVAIDVNDYEEWIFKGTWGVSDEDLFKKTHRVLTQSSEPVFAVAFTSSFHSPYEFPDGRIELYDQPRQSKHNAVKYADFALGQFIDRARHADYYANTLILIVADHDERPRGFDLVPVSSYHIPGVILGGGVSPRRISRIASQIDLAPTLFDLAGISGIAPLPGQSVVAAAENSPGRALMQYGDNHAYLRGQDIVIHCPEQPAAQFVYNEATDQLKPVPLMPELAERALAWALIPGLMYREKLYRPYRVETTE